MDRLFLVSGSAAAFLAVLFGAFGAHALRARLDAKLLDTFEIGVRYQMYHALALLAVAWLVQRGAGSMGVFAGYGFLLGMLLFSGSLYAYVLSGVRGLAMITPVGGLCFLIGWVCLAIAAWRLR
jgi:uncharacterized membrane protein YgdD (TMEM256/DUF423 family)